MSVDHLSPLQAHWTDSDDDGCSDTPWRSSINQLGCNDNPKDRCALTQCQLGRIHHFFTEKTLPLSASPTAAAAIRQC
ncbi:MAG: hypothetical protein H6559_11505 [Lewinellaceae bacterium]|nr:hypothetical protein [Lewinellaceae bacterium]